MSYNNIIIILISLSSCNVSVLLSLGGLHKECTKQPADPLDYQVSDSSPFTIQEHIWKTGHLVSPSEVRIHCFLLPLQHGFYILILRKNMGLSLSHHQYAAHSLDKV